MSELFICEGQNIYFTNGGGEALVAAMFRASKCLLEKASPNHQSLIDFLERSANAGNGCCSFGIDFEVLPEALRGTVEVQCLAQVLDAIVGDLQKQRPQFFEDDVNWDPELQKSWLARVEKLRDAARRNVQQIRCTANGQNQIG